MQEIINLKTCHSESGVWQMFGICNSAKDALNVCFKREVRPLPYSIRRFLTPLTAK